MNNISEILLNIIFRKYVSVSHRFKAKNSKVFKLHNPIIIISCLYIIEHVKCDLSNCFCVLQWKKSDHDDKLHWFSMIFISVAMSIIIQKNKLCPSKIRVIYFCPNCVNCLPEKCSFLKFLEDNCPLPPCSLSSCTCGVSFSKT